MEKNTRGKLRSAVDRLVGKTSVTILDSGNFIKGYRYELWCKAREAATRYCAVHVDTPPEVCRRWNAARPEEQRYEKAVFEDLAGRFERPDARNRWDAPLFTVRPAAAAASPSGPPAAGAAAVAAAASRQGDVSAPEDRSSEGDGEAWRASDSGAEASREQVLEAAVKAMLDPGNPNQQLQVAKVLQPTCATTNPALSATNALHEIDAAAQDVIHAIMQAQAEAAGDAPGIVRFGEHAPPLQLPQAVTLAELRRHKRSFLKLATKITFARIQDADAGRRLFIDHLRQHLSGQ